MVSLRQPAPAAGGGRAGRQPGRHPGVRRGAAAVQGPVRGGRRGRARAVQRLPPGHVPATHRQGLGPRRGADRQAGPGRGRYRAGLRLHPQHVHDRSSARHPSGQCGGVGVRPGELRLPAGRLRVGGRVQPDRGLPEAPGVAGGQRLPLRRVHRLGGPGLPHQPVARLQDRELRRGAARAPLRVCGHPHGGVGPRPEVPPVGRAAGLRRRRDRLPARRLGVGDRGRDRSGVHRLRAGDRGRGGVDSRALGVAGRSLPPRRGVSRRPRRVTDGHVDVLAFAGGRGPAALRRRFPHRPSTATRRCCTWS